MMRGILSDTIGISRIVLNYSKSKSTKTKPVGLLYSLCHRKVHSCSPPAIYRSKWLWCYTDTNTFDHAKLLSQQLPRTCNQIRCFWGVDVAFNRVDEERVRLAGPDRAAAEWVLRNGGVIKWASSAFHLTDYNLLPSTQFDSYKLEEVDLSGTDVIGLGFEHLKDLHHVKSIKMHNCKTIGDDGLAHLVHVADTLTSLEICSCPMITQRGLDNILQLKKLQHLVLFDLMEVKDLGAVGAHLQRQMPNVDIKITDPRLAAQHEKPK